MRNGPYMKASKNNNETFLKTKRIELRLTQQEIADKAGIKASQYSRIEAGDRELSSASFMTTYGILKALEIDVEEYYKSEFEKMINND